LTEFAEWLSRTYLSVLLQDHNRWAIPTIQSIHITGIGFVLISVFLVDLRILGWAGTDRTLRQTTSRFRPWMMTALFVLLVTGLLMVIAEPVRELVTLSFWLKMFLVAVGTLVAALFLRALRNNEEQWEKTLVNRRPIQVLAVLTFFVWVAVIILGRLIAYDHIWGSWSPSPRL
jgi:hypothetical protein